MQLLTTSTHLVRVGLAVAAERGGCLAGSLTDLLGPFSFGDSTLLTIRGVSQVKSAAAAEATNPKLSVYSVASHCCHNTILTTVDNPPLTLIQQYGGELQRNKPVKTQLKHVSPPGEVHKCRNTNGPLAPASVSRRGEALGRKRLTVIDRKLGQYKR